MEVSPVFSGKLPSILSDKKSLPDRDSEKRNFLRKALGGLHAKGIIAVHSFEGVSELDLLIDMSLGRTSLENNGFYQSGGRFLWRWFHEVISLVIDGPLFISADWNCMPTALWVPGRRRSASHILTNRRIEASKSWGSNNWRRCRCGRLPMAFQRRYMRSVTAPSKVRITGSFDDREEIPPECERFTHWARSTGRSRGYSKICEIWHQHM